MLTRHTLYLLAAALLIVLLCLAGCGGKERPHTLLLLDFDETSSFVAPGYWEQSIRMARIAVDHLGPGDAVAVIGIDDHGFDSDDIRLPITVFSRGTLQAVADRNALKARLSTLQARPTSSGFRLPNGKMRGIPCGTDLLGAIDQTASLAAYYPQMRTRVLLLSDMQDDPGSSPSGYSGEKVLFSGDSKAMALFVDESGGAEWKARVTRWNSTLNGMGLACHPTDFLAPGASTPSAMALVFQRWLHE